MMLDPLSHALGGKDPSGVRQNAYYFPLEALVMDQCQLGTYRGGENRKGELRRARPAITPFKARR